MRTFRNSTCLILGLLASATCCVNAAEFSTDSGFHISGPIVKGDYVKLGRYLVDARHPKRVTIFLNRITLDSPGGDVDEALKIARLIEISYALTFVEKNAECNSACFLLWSAGVTRLNEGVIGVHRISVRSNSADVRATEKLVAPASQTVEQFLVKNGVPRRVIEKMSETPPSDLFVLSNDWLIREDLLFTIQDRPSFFDVAEKRCGTSPIGIAVRNGSRASRLEVSTWMGCADDVRVENQQTHLQEITDAFVAARFGR